MIYFGECTKELNNTGEQETRGAKPVSAEEHIRELAEIVQSAFAVESCRRNHENEMALIQIAPNARSIQYAREYCNKKARPARAINPPDAKRPKRLKHT